jgi:hypothetical protein
MSSDLVTRLRAYHHVYGLVDKPSLYEVAAVRLEELEVDRDHWLEAADKYHQRMCKMAAALRTIAERETDTREAFEIIEIARLALAVDAHE